MLGREFRQFRKLRLQERHDDGERVQAALLVSRQNRPVDAFEHLRRAASHRFQRVLEPMREPIQRRGRVKSLSVGQRSDGRIDEFS